ncbi:unnamed protein product [Oncorhynchus mykiss]|uniref:Proteasome activator complex subunit 4 C-terminal domain-containing protein n=1 Tax=Oncorhynchus mykiss TaxID=8022 RepID=A0A061AG20_ONCMY|nr:unnamed protein product [Oncorhynchus mykiss]
MVVLDRLLKCICLDLAEHVIAQFFNAPPPPPPSCVDLVRRHAGVLGLSACILSSPYDVPSWMPQLLMNLSVHLNDTQPIEMSVKKTLSNFRRTHHDNWQEHKQQFTDDQLLVLTDLLVSPCYYA